jgi:ATP-dependent Clp protease ATP-binding subunit ClpC
MFERFTAKARHVVVLAQEEARELNHNYIGTEHILLGLIHEDQGLAARVLTEQFGLTLDGIRQEITEIVGTGKKPQPTGHIPFTPRAKKVLELSLREALQLSHNYIGTEHILLGVIREADGVGAQVLRQHADLLRIRTAVLDLLGTTSSPLEASQRRRWLRRRISFPGDPTRQIHIALPEGEEHADEPGLTATPAADATLSAAAKLAGADPVGSHHLLLAALTDANSAAARVLTSLGVDLSRAKDALRDADVVGTSDEQPEEAGKRQMVIQVTPELVTITVADPVLVKSANEALEALGSPAAQAVSEQAVSEQAVTPANTIRGADLAGAPAASLAKAWQALQDTLTAITARQQAGPPGPGPEGEPAADPGASGSPAA